MLICFIKIDCELKGVRRCPPFPAVPYVSVVTFPSCAECVFTCSRSDGKGFIVAPTKNDSLSARVRPQAVMAGIDDCRCLGDSSRRWWFVPHVHIIMTVSKNRLILGWWCCFYHNSLTHSDRHHNMSGISRTRLRLFIRALTARSIDLVPNQRFLIFLKAS